MRRALIGFAVLALAACGGGALSADEARQAAVDAFDEAGLDAGDPSQAERADVDIATDDETGTVRTRSVWLLTIDVEGEEWTVGVDPDDGAIVRTFEPEGSELTPAQVEALASYRAESGSSTARSLLVLLVLSALAGGGYWALRTLAQRDRARPPVPDPDDVA